MERHDKQIEAIRKQAYILQLLDIHPSTLWRWIQAGNFPKPTKYGAKTQGWRQSVIEKWLEDRENMSNEEK